MGKHKSLTDLKSFDLKFRNGLKTGYAKWMLGSEQLNCVTCSNVWIESKRILDTTSVSLSVRVYQIAIMKCFLFAFSPSRHFTTKTR